MEHTLNVTSKVYATRKAGMGKCAIVGDAHTLASFQAKMAMLGISLDGAQEFLGHALIVTPEHLDAIKDCPLFNLVEYESSTAASVAFRQENQQGAANSR